MALCPRAYTDDELLLLLTVLGKVSLDTCLVLQTSVELYPLLCTVVCNIRDWDTMVSLNIFREMLCILENWLKIIGMHSISGYIPNLSVFIFPAG